MTTPATQRTTKPIGGHSHGYSNGRLRTHAASSHGRQPLLESGRWERLERPDRQMVPPSQNGPGRGIPQPSLIGPPLPVCAAASGHPGAPGAPASLSRR